MLTRLAYESCQFIPTASYANVSIQTKGYYNIQSLPCINLYHIYIFLLLTDYQLWQDLDNFNFFLSWSSFIKSLNFSQRNSNSKHLWFINFTQLPCAGYMVFIQELVFMVFFKNIFRYATSYTDKRSIYSGSRDNYKFKLIPAKVICIAKSTCICPDLFEILAKAYCHFAPLVHHK